MFNCKLAPYTLLRIWGFFYVFMTWRDSCRPIIAKVLADNKGNSEKEIRIALRDAYPFGERRMHPYKIWCDEIKRQRGLKPKLGVTILKDSNNQTKLF